MLSTLQTQGMKGFDISNDELAKSHARYMIGGCANVPTERIFRFGVYAVVVFWYSIWTYSSHVSRVPGAARGFEEIFVGHSFRLEHLPFPLPKPRRR